MADIKTEKQKVQEITEKLEQGIKELFENEEYKFSFDTIRNAASELITNIEGRLEELQKDRVTEQEQDIPEETSEENPYATDKVSYYVIEDLSTWAERGTENSKLERFDSLPEAMGKFSEYRGKDAGDKEDEARATFGFRVNGMEFDLIHVRNKENCLSLDFTHSKAAQESRQFMEDLQVLSDKIGFDKVRVHREMTPEEVKDFIKQRFEYRLKQGGLEDISLYMDRFDTLYEQGKMEHLLPTANQKHIIEDIPFTEWENPYIDIKYDKGQLDESELAFRIADRFISIQENDEGYDYTVYDMDYRGLDGGVYDNPDISIRQALDEIVQDLKESIHQSQIEGSIQKDDELIPVNYDELMEKVEQAEQEQSKGELHKEADGADRLAAEIDRFSYKYDTVQYNEVVEDREAQVENIAADIRSGNTEYLHDFLNAAISEEVRMGITDIFGQGVEIGESEAVQTVRKAKELSDRLAEYKPLAKIEELEEANYNMIDNVLNNEKPKKEEERPQGRISVKEKLAEKKAVIEQKGKDKNLSQDRENNISHQDR